MNEYLRSVFTSEEIELAGAIGQNSQLRLEEKIDAVFRELGDPLLATEDVVELLGTSAEVEDVKAEIDNLVGSNVLEFSTTTLRPKDIEGVVLYRRKGVPTSRLKLVALETQLSNGTSRFQFTCDGRLVRSIARIDRLDALSDSGQQREEILAHVDRISEGIRAGIQIPNSILLVLVKSQLVEDQGDDSAPHSFIQY